MFDEKKQNLNSDIRARGQIKRQCPLETKGTFCGGLQKCGAFGGSKRF